MTHNAQVLCQPSLRRTIYNVNIRLDWWYVKVARLTSWERQTCSERLLLGSLLFIYRPAIFLLIFLPVFSFPIDPLDKRPAHFGICFYHCPFRLVTVLGWDFLKISISTLKPLVTNKRTRAFQTEKFLGQLFSRSWKCRSGLVAYSVEMISRISRTTVSRAMSGSTLKTKCRNMS